MNGKYWNLYQGVSKNNVTKCSQVLEPFFFVAQNKTIEIPSQITTDPFPSFTLRNVRQLPNEESPVQRPKKQVSYSINAHHKHFLLKARIQKERRDPLPQTVSDKNLDIN